MGFLVIVAYLLMGALGQPQVNPDKQVTPGAALAYWKRPGSQRPCRTGFEASDCKASGTNNGATLADQYVGAFCDTVLGTETVEGTSTQLKDVDREDKGTHPGGFDGICVACPNTVTCAQAFAGGLIKDQSACTTFCETNSATNLVSCSLRTYEEDCGLDPGDEQIAFCNGVSYTDKTGYCTACQVVDTNLAGDSVQANDYPVFTGNNVRFNTVFNCEYHDYDATLIGFGAKFTAVDSSTANYLADVQLSSLCETNGNVVPCCGKSTNHKLMCEGGAAAIVGDIGFQSTASVFDWELEQCGGRKCGDGSAAFPETDMCYKDPQGTNTNPPTACVSVGVVADVSKRQTKIAGYCLDGYCSVTDHQNGHSCPVGVPIQTEKVEMQGCGSSGTSRSAANLQAQMIHTGGAPDYEPGSFGHQSEALYCQSESTLAPSENINALFSTYFFDVFQTHQAINIQFVYNTNQGARFKQTRGRCIIGMDDKVRPTASPTYPYQDDAMFTSTTLSFNNRAGPHITTDPNCIISNGGYYSYKGMEITWAVVKLDSNGDRDDDCHLSRNPTGGATQCAAVETVMLVPVQTRSLMQVAGCPSDGDGTTTLTNRCKGSIVCDYSTDWPCGHKFHTCEGTAPPTHEPSGSIHGDPIVWTFDDECYDLHKDGMYKASAHPSYGHSVHIAVYNDYMREIQVRGEDGEILLAINTLGMVENNWQHFLYEKERECPPDLYDCIDTFMEYAFDAQDFRYVVQILHHNYKDPALENGEYGFHLDVKPQPYARFQQNKDGYSGLYFENPLPEELEFCKGGSKK